MRNGRIMFLLLALLAVILVACGGSEAEDTAASKPAASKPAAAKPAADSLTLEKAAAQRAGGPGSFYVGDLSQLVGPAPGPTLGDADDMINLAGLERERYLFDSPYFECLVE